MALHWKFDANLSEPIGYSGTTQPNSTINTSNERAQRAESKKNYVY